MSRTAASWELSIHQITRYQCPVDTFLIIHDISWITTSVQLCHICCNCNDVAYLNCLFVRIYSEIQINWCILIRWGGGGGMSVTENKSLNKSLNYVIFGTNNSKLNLKYSTDCIFLSKCHISSMKYRERNDHINECLDWKVITNYQWLVSEK